MNEGQNQILLYPQPGLLATKQWDSVKQYGRSNGTSGLGKQDMLLVSLLVSLLELTPAGIQESKIVLR